MTQSFSSLLRTVARELGVQILARHTYKHTGVQLTGSTGTTGAATSFFEHEKVQTKRCFLVTITAHAHAKGGISF